MPWLNITELHGALTFKGFKNVRMMSYHNIFWNVKQYFAIFHSCHNPSVMIGGITRSVSSISELNISQQEEKDKILGGNVKKILK